MATDYDAPRKNEDEQSEESIEELKARRHDKNSGKVDEDETEAAESFELPGADLSHEELAVEVKPTQEDEFTCMSCFLVHHRSQLADAKKMICRDCAAWAAVAPGAARRWPEGSEQEMEEDRNPAGLRSSCVSGARLRGSGVSPGGHASWSSFCRSGGRWPVERA